MAEADDRKAFTAANLEAWEQVAPIHARHNQAALLETFAAPGASVLDELETAVLTRIGIAGKACAQLCCNNGQELLSLNAMGAARLVGFDGAPGFVEQARALAAAGGISADFHAGDIYEIDPVHDDAFDLVTVTIGVLSWMPDLPGFFAVAARLLRPGGTFFLYEQHPVLEMLKPGKAGDPVEWELSYFDSAPFVDHDGLDYYGGERYEAKPATSCLHKISDVIMAGLGAGFRIEAFAEHPHHISNTWYNVEAAELGVPMCYTLVLRKA